MPQDMNVTEHRAYMPDQRTKALVAVGSNVRFDDTSLGSTINRALDRLVHYAGSIPAVSRLYTTPCFPPGAGPDYVNAVFEWDMGLPPARALATLHKVEQDFGRIRTERWGERTLDLDLLAIGARVIPDTATLMHWIGLPLEAQQSTAPDTLLLPHPRIQDRSFVLVPLCDIAPDWVHPVTGLTAREMRDALPAGDLGSVKPLVNQAEHT